MNHDVIAQHGALTSQLGFVRSADTRKGDHDRLPDADRYRVAARTMEDVLVVPVLVVHQPRLALDHKCTARVADVLDAELEGADSAVAELGRLSERDLL